MHRTQRARSVLLSTTIALGTVGCGSTPSSENPALVEQTLLDAQPSGPDQNAVVAVFSPDTDWCTGVVVAPTLVLTSRHFIFDPARGGPSDEQCKPNGQGAPVKQIVDFPMYKVAVGNKQPIATAARIARVFAGSDLDLCKNDVALVELDTPTDITPLRMRLGGLPRAGDPGVVVGWGQDRDESTPALGKQRLQVHREVRVLSSDHVTFTTDSGACLRDDGAPFIPDQAGGVAGIFSRFVDGDDTGEAGADANFGDCTGTQDVFQSLYQQRDWIRDAFAELGYSDLLPVPVGGSCQASDECSSKLCLTTSDAGFCSVECDTEACPADMQCVGDNGKRRCVPAQVPSSAVSSQGCSLVGDADATPRTAWNAVAFLAACLFRGRRRNHAFRSQNPLRTYQRHSK